MSDSSDHVKTIFLEAIERHAPDEWPAFLDEACAGDAALRAGVEKLLCAQAALGSFHEPEDPPAPTIDQSPIERPGTSLGSYKLLQQIGEGGMGIVFMAEQTQPVRRKIAIKVIKPGMDSRQVIARFEAERQALAMMDHVNIARVFDGGTTENGRPYFAMELVHGVPITKYCDENRLTPRQRLELFVPVCQAIQHAHQKGIIHRDIKPSNIMVTLYDGKPVAKVIDFGVAKATEQKLTERTLFTQYGTLVGTLEYMSPEQAEMSALGVDTRSDIYSLGVLLYELLTGSTPLTRNRTKEAAYGEILRMIREEEPPKPSTRLSDSGQALASISANRHTEPAKLAKLMRGELDWIVMKTLEKDRNRRYETASGFALDIQRYLADEPVLACPPSAVYRFRKFVRRNKTGLAVAGLVLFFLVLIGSGAGWALRDRAAREADLAGDKATRQRKLNFEIEYALDDATKARTLALALTDNPYDWDAALAEAASELKRASGLAAQAETTLEPALREGLQALQALLDADQADHRFAARFEEIRLEQAQVNVEISAFKFEIAFPALQEAFQRNYRIEFGATPVEQAVVTLQQRPKPMLDVLLAALEICLDQVPKDDRQVRPWLAAVLDGADTGPWRKRSQQALQASDWKAFEQVIEQAVTARQPPALLLRLAWKIPWDSPICLKVMRRIRQAYPGDFWANHDLAQILHYRHSRPAEAIRYYTAAQALRSHNPATCVDLGNALREIGELDAAISAYREALDGHPDYAGALERLIQALSQKPDLDETIDELREMIRSRDHAPATSADGAALSILHFRLADLLSSQKRFAEADTAYQIARAGWEKLIAEFNHADHHTQLGGALLNWALSCKANGRMEEAEIIFREAALAFEALQTNFPNESRWAIHELGYIYFQLGELLSGFHGREEDGEKAYRQSLGYHEEQLAQDPENRDYQERMTWSYSGLARLLRKSKRSTEALPFDAKRVLLVQKLASGTTLARDLNHLAWNLAVDPDPQMRDPEQAVELADKAVALEPAQGSYWNTLGTAQYRAGNWQQAIEALKTSEQVFRGAHFGFNAFFLAMAHWQRGDHEQARKCYAAAQVWMERHASKNEELLRFRGEAAALLGVPEQLSTDQEEAKSDDLKYGTLIVAARPEAAWAYQLRAQTLVGLDQIDRAEADFAKAIELSADDVMVRYSQALARAATGDLTGYRGACAAMLDRFAATDKPDVAHWVAWTTAIVPDAVDDLHRPVQLAELARKSEPDNGSFSNALGAALYRAGDFDEAAATLNELNTAWQQAATRPITYSPAYTWFFLAMTHQRLGDADEARQWLDKAIAWAERENQNDGTSWNRRVTLQLLRREAETLLGERAEAAGTEEDAERN